MSREDKTDLAQWQPRALIHAARALSLPEFLLSCDSAFMLLVMLRPGDSELACGLDASERNENDGLSFQTATRDLGATITRHSVRDRGAASSIAAGTGRQFTEQTSERLPLVLARASCYVVPICKRSEVSFLQQVSVGRARNHDIVLRHRSVSKFHAWFELNQEVRLFVKDCDSSNYTFVNGERVLDRAEVCPGDSVRFGAVESRVCTSEGLWKLARG